jgi:hypothetical protein
MKISNLFLMVPCIFGIFLLSGLLAIVMAPLILFYYFFNKDFRKVFNEMWFPDKEIHK